MNGFNHFDAQGKAIMVDVTDKAATHRVAEARGEILVNEAVMTAIQTGTAKKGDVLGVARVAASWRSSAPATSSPCATPWRCPAVRWISTCSPGRERWRRYAPSRSPAAPEWRWRPSPGVSVALLTIYDMCKAVDRAMTITNVRLMRKEGGKSGVFVREG